MCFNKKELNFSGIYKILNLVTNDFYIGSTKNFYKRFHCHYSMLKNNIHPNIHLQRAVNKYGIENFKFDMFKICDYDNIIAVEQSYIDILKPRYNIRKIADNNTGISRSVETRLKQSISMKKRKFSKEHMDKIIKSRFGRKFSKETVEKIKSKLKGQKRTDEFKKLRSVQQSKIIYQYNLNGEFIKEWESAKQASIFYNLKGGGIANAASLKGRKKTSCGFIWRYKEDVDKSINLIKEEW